MARYTNTASTFYTFDAQGNVCQKYTTPYGLTTFTLQSTSVFDAYGTKVSTETQVDPWGYEAQVGYYTDVETGLLLLTHRYYDPTQGRFINRDPIGYAGGINLYGYVGNGPVVAADSSGYAPGFGTIMWQALSDTWAAPNDLIGGIAAIGGSWQVDNANGAFKVQGGWLAWIVTQCGSDAITIGHFVMFEQPLSDQIYQHELQHVHQGDHLGPFYLPGYGLGAIAGAMGGSIHDANPYEYLADRGAGIPNPYDPANYHVQVAPPRPPYVAPGRAISPSVPADTMGLEWPGMGTRN